MEIVRYQVQGDIMKQMVNGRTFADTLSDIIELACQVLHQIFYIDRIM